MLSYQFLRAIGTPLQAIWTLMVPGGVSLRG